MKIRFTAFSRKRLQDIESYHTKKGNKTKGRKITREVKEKAKKLEDFPYMGQEEEGLKDLNRGHRYLLIKPFYKLIYLIIKPIIYITDIFDTRQDQDKMKP